MIRLPFFAIKKRLAIVVVIFSLLCLDSKGQGDQRMPAYQDRSHFSAAFGKQKYFRLYLPDAYSQGMGRFPVIYYFHGWSERYSRSIAGIEFEKIKDLVNKYKVILVMWDGNIKETDPRPYNVGNHPDVKDEVQMKDYFLELVSHIDSNYRTLTNRVNRGLMGFSMGGYMSFFLAGKYPDKICAAVDMTGSSEFFIGHPMNHTLYQLQYTFKNLREVRLRMHNNDDFISILNTQVYKSALWEGVPVDYWYFPGDHKIDDPGKTDAFEKAVRFIVEAFKDPIPPPNNWWHYDLYPKFEIWNYIVKTDKQEPGFIYLKNVTRNGFGIYTHKWLPAGPPVKQIRGEVITAPIYQPNTSFEIVKYSQGKLFNEAAKSDAEGRLRFIQDLNGYEIGISKKGDNPEMILLDYSLDKNRRFLRAGKTNSIRLKIFNRGGVTNTNKQVKLILAPMDSAVTVVNEALKVEMRPNERVVTSPSFDINCSKKPGPRLEPIWIKFRLSMHMDSNVFEDELMAPVFFDVPVFEKVKLDDGLKVKDSIYGKGNGNGIANAGEGIMVYIDGKRARVYTDDPYVEAAEEKLVDEILPGTSGDGYTLSTVIKIKSNCPRGHIIECLANYETKTDRTVVPIDRKLTWGKVLIQTN